MRKYTNAALNLNAGMSINKTQQTTSTTLNLHNLFFLKARAYPMDCNFFKLFITIHSHNNHNISDDNS